MTLRVLASFHDRDLASTSFARARELANDRKVMRMLEAVSSAGFVATLEAFALADLPHSADVGLFTVSGWDMGAPIPEVDSDGPRREALARQLAKSGDPTPWLRALCNAALCQASVNAGFHGPSTHFVGDGRSVRLALVLAETMMDRPDTSAIIVTAFDPDPDSEQASGRGAAVVLGPSATTHAINPGSVVLWQDDVPTTDAFTALAHLIGRIDAARPNGPVYMDVGL